MTKPGFTFSFGETLKSWGFFRHYPRDSWPGSLGSSVGCCMLYVTFMFCHKIALHGFFTHSTPLIAPRKQKNLKVKTIVSFSLFLDYIRMITCVMRTQKYKIGMQHFTSCVTQINACIIWFDTLNLKRECNNLSFHYKFIIIRYSFSPLV